MLVDKDHPLTRERLDALEEKINKVLSDQGLPPLVVGDHAGQVTVRFNNRRKYERQNTENNKKREKEKR